MTMNIQQALNHITKNIHLSQPQMEDVMRSIMQGEATDAQIGALMMGLRMKGESIDEITAAARIMREFAIKIDVSDIPHLVDIVGTGGDGQNLFNVSTASSFVIAAAGATIAKHGNRGVSSKSGSSDVLEQMGIQLDLDMQQTERCIREIGVGFLFAPNHHKAMRYAVAPRRELGIRSIFNLLGPLSNPAQPTYQFTGVYHPDILPLYNYVLSKNTKNHNIVHAVDVFDEVSLTCPFYLVGKMHNELIHPQDLNLPQVALSKISGGNDLQTSGEILVNILQGKGTKEQNNVVAVNAGIAIHTATNLSLNQSIQEALEIIQSGKAYQNLQNLIRCNQQ